MNLPTIIISIVGLTLIIKSLIGLTIPSKYYGFKRQQYGSPQRPINIFFIPALATILSVALWLSDLTSTFEFVFAAFISIISFIGILNITLLWEKHRERALKSMASNFTTVRKIDIGLLIFGCFILIMTFLNLK